MPKRRGTPFSLKSTAGHIQRECSPPPLSGGRRAPPGVPGRIPLREEAALFSGVTKASAEPETGAILLGPSIHSITEGSSPQSTESDFGNSRLGGMGRLPDGYSHPMSDSDNIPLRNNNHKLETLVLPAPSPSGDILAGLPLILANSGTDPTTNGFCGLSEMETDERQEETKEQTINADTFNPHLFDSTVLIDNLVSRQLLITDPHKKLNISVVVDKYRQVII